MSPFEELSAWNVRLKAEFPNRLVGELELSEAEFRDLLAALTRFGATNSLHVPPAMFPRLTLVSMTFTARYDYEGAFWSAFCDNLRVEAVDRTAWGSAYRKALRSFGLFTPPEHWMVNVFPVLFHSIVPEASLEDFAIMCRALFDTVDVSLLDDYELAAAIETAALPRTLYRFITGNESKAVALELVRHIAEDLRLGLELPDSTLRGRILVAARAATEARSRLYSVQIQPLPWRYDFNTGRCGVWLASSRHFDQQPYRVALGSFEAEVRSEKVGDGFVLLPQLISLPFSSAGADGTLDSYSTTLVRLRVGRSPQSIPFIFRSIGVAGTYESASSGPPGDYAIADDGTAVVTDGDGQVVDCLEELPTLRVPGVSSARLYALDEGSKVTAHGAQTFVVQAATRPSIEIRARSFWQLADSRTSIRVVSTIPTLDVRSPQAGSEFVAFESSRQTPTTMLAFAERIKLRLDAAPATVYRTSVWVDGRPSGASGCDFIFLPFVTAVGSRAGEQSMTLSGTGRLTLGSRVITLQEDGDAELPLADLLLNVDATYELGGRIFVLRYIGVRPVAWGFERGLVDTRTLSLRADQLESHPRLVVTGNAGTSVSLVAEGKVFSTASIDSHGFASLELKDTVPMALARGYIKVCIDGPERQLHVLDMFGVPQVRHETVVYREGLLDGEFALDGAVESLTLNASPFRTPWRENQARPCSGSGRSWSIAAELPDQRYSLSLTGVVNGTPVGILSGGVGWTKECGAGSDTRTRLDVYLYELLTGRDRGYTASFTASDLVEVIRRCFQMLEMNPRRQERANIELLFRQLAKYLRVGDIAAVEQLVTAAPYDVVSFASHCGLPTAAFRVLSGQDTYGPITEPEARIAEQFINFNSSGHTVDDESALAAAIEQFEKFPDPLIRSYATLLRKIRVCRGEAMEALSNVFEGRQLAEAVLDVNRSGEIERWAGDEPTSPSFFAIVVRRTWALAIVSRKARRLIPASVLPAAVGIASALLDDYVVGDFLRLALNRVEADIALTETGASA